MQTMWHLQKHHQKSLFVMQITNLDPELLNLHFSTVALTK